MIARSRSPKKKNEDIPASILRRVSVLFIRGGTLRIFLGQADLFPVIRNRALILLAVLSFTIISTGASSGERERIIELLQDAQKAYNDGVYARAEKDCRSVIATDPQIYQSYNLLGMIYSRDDDKKKAAIEALDKSLSIQPKQLEVYSLLGYLYNNAGDHAAASKTLERGQALFPGDFQMNFNLGLTYLLARQDPYKALEVFHLAEKVKPDNEKLLYIIGMAHLMIGENNKVLECITKLRQYKKENLAIMLEDALRDSKSGNVMNIEDALNGVSEPQGVVQARTGTGKAIIEGTIVGGTVSGHPTYQTTPQQPAAKKKPGNPFAAAKKR